LLQSVKKSILRRHKWLEKTEKPRETRMHWNARQAYIHCLHIK
jgi:hypothetical protein